MRKLTVGLFAHVDAGKSTFAENIIKERNDVSFTFLDQFIEERKRGITIFLKTIKLLGEDYEITFLDTPGHRDFIKERKRALQAIDIALFILPANEMISNASKIIFNELKDNHIPIIVLIFLVWIVKIIFGVKISVPDINKKKKIEDKEKVSQNT